MESQYSLAKAGESQGLPIYIRAHISENWNRTEMKTKWKALPPRTYLEISGQFAESQQKSLSPEIRTWIPFCPILTHQTYLELITECSLRKLSSQCPAWMSDLCRCSCGVFVHHPLASLLLLSASLRLSTPTAPASLCFGLITISHSLSSPPSPPLRSVLLAPGCLH